MCGICDHTHEWVKMFRFAWWCATSSLHRTRLMTIWIVSIAIVVQYIVRWTNKLKITDCVRSASFLLFLLLPLPQTMGSNFNFGHNNKWSAWPNGSSHILDEINWFEWTVLCVKHVINDDVGAKPCCHLVLRTVCCYQHTRQTIHNTNVCKGKESKGFSILCMGKDSCWAVARDNNINRIIFLETIQCGKKANFWYCQFEWLVELVL